MMQQVNCPKTARIDKGILIWLLGVGLMGLAGVLLGACSNQMPPSGGPKDSLRPVLRRSIPRHQSTNYQGQVVILEFDEWVKEKNLRQELLITPPGTRFTHQIKRTQVEIQFEEPLRENTTYSINFRNSIVDITEGNIALSDTVRLRPLKIAFSTGPVIDSAHISGQVRRRLSNDTLSNVVVALYRSDDTLRVDKHKPYYFTLSEKTGRFELENLRLGDYQLFAFQDLNNNLIYDEREAFDFLSRPIRLGADTAFLDNVDLFLAPEDKSPPEIRRSNPAGNAYEILFSEGLTQCRAFTQNPADSAKIAYALQDNGNTLTLFNPKATFDSLALRIEALDSAGNFAQLETNIQFRENRDEKNRRGRTLKSGSSLTIDIIPVGKTGFDKEVDFSLDFNVPIQSIQFSQIRYLPDGDSTRIAPLLYPDSSQHYQWNENRSRLRVYRPTLRYQKSIQLLVDSVAFISVMGDSSRAFQKVISRKDVNDFGSIYGKVQTQEPAYIVQLLDAKNEIVAETANTPQFEFNFLPAGDYRLRIVLDRNQNGRWDPSDWKNGVRAEELLFPVLPNEGKLRERWDIEAQINF
ncbi:MAG: hypothetical protein HC913_13105 [Microscillaceae bacterium]|nr:hypothetical protein [Microscillaceae bacterium]